MSHTILNQKAQEQQVQKTLFNNIRLLTQIYPAPKELKAELRPDMFAKNNKAGFIQTVYYLLTTLNPKVIKSKITSWPAYDPKTESSFRREVLQYVNELNALYLSADIPTVMASQLISPSGLKFLMFMLKLSELVIVEHLTRNNVQFDNPVKLSKDKRVNRNRIKQLQKKTQAIEMETAKQYREGEVESEKLSQTASHIDSVFDKYCLKLKILKENLAKAGVNEELISREQVEDVVENFKKKTAGFREVQELLTEIDKVRKTIEKRPVMENVTAEFNVIDHWNSLITRIMEYNLQIKGAPISKLKHYACRIEKMNEVLENHEKRLLELKENLRSSKNDLVVEVEYEKVGPDLRI